MLIRKRKSLFSDPSCVLALNLSKKDGSSFASDDKYGHVCTNYGSTWLPSGRSFDGVDDGILIDNKSLFDMGSGDMAGFARIRWSYQLSSQRILCFGLYQAYGWHWWITNGVPASETNQAGASQHSYGKVLAPDVWTTVAFVRKGSSIRHYQDGVDITANPEVHIDPVNNAVEKLGIGNRQDLARGYSGIISLVLLFKRALTSPEIAELHTKVM
jgi:hypothetical protein